MNGYIINNKMKKTVFLLIMVALATTMYAQESYNKPEVPKFMLEVGFTPLQTETITLMGEQLRGTYLLNNKIGIRFGLGFATATANYDDKQANYTKESETISQFSLTPGIIYSFEGTNRLTPYVGFEFLLGTTSNKSTREVRTANNLVKTVTTNADGAFNTFGANLFTGFNYYFAQNIFVGVEVGLGVRNMSVKQQSVKITSDGSTTTRDTEEEIGALGVGLICNPSIRLGWAF